MVSFGLIFLNNFSAKAAGLIALENCRMSSFYCVTAVNLLYLNSPAYLDELQNCYADHNSVYYLNCPSFAPLSERVETIETMRGRILGVEEIGHYR